MMRAKFQKELPNRRAVVVAVPGGALDSRSYPSSVGLHLVHFSLRMGHFQRP